MNVPIHLDTMLHSSQIPSQVQHHWILPTRGRTGPTQTAHAWLLVSLWPSASAGGSRLASCPKEHSAHPGTLTALFHLILTGLWLALVISQVGRQRHREVQNNFQALLLRACTATCAVGCVSQHFHGRAQEQRTGNIQYSEGW